MKLMTREDFITIVDALKAGYEHHSRMIDVLSEFDISLMFDKNKPEANALEKLLKGSFDEDDMSIIYDWCYPIFEEPFIMYDYSINLDGDAIQIDNAGELYDRLIKNGFYDAAWDVNNETIGGKE